MPHPDGMPPQQPGKLWLTEGGIETEIMYKWGHELPQFAMFPLLDNPAALQAMQDMWRRSLDVAAQHGFSMVMNGLDYRASPDWAALLGYSLEGLAEMQHRSIDFLRELRDEYTGQIPDMVVCGTVGPRGDAYGLNRDITADSAEEYHAVQLTTLREAGAEMAWTMTFNNIPEAVGAIRAARAIGLPIVMGLTLDSNARLKSGPSLGEAIERIDAEAGGGPEFYLLNCSHPVEFEPALDGGDWERRIRALRPNASKMEKIALCQLGHLEEGNPVELGQLMGDLARRQPQIDIWGGCCGTCEVHLEEIARNVKAARMEMA
ncbi:homocysteine S-methyltransferase family protein [Tropicimonas isoalkanivorans]|uniref:Homocysteine S-methyltransferase n=1 Tax=Tropicimonas isoalkanivorans TaxID=441112 RepID=A0A1I1ECX2_9RHOB|nr:homocysteine S-methyltransferase family protein [Tropicimonas isoalkanivorans]SFB84432.1 homocysteine S-methyltransferase [Tropicimonas isoalkanivorans]